MGVTVIFYRLFQFKDDSAAIFKRLSLPWHRNLQIDLSGNYVTAKTVFKLVPP